jgi:GDP-L-fucose synthase
MHEAKKNGITEVKLWGTGTPRREFLYSEDAADACLHLLRLPDQYLNEALLHRATHPIINVGYGEDITIRDVSELIAEVIGFNGTITFDPSMPDGTPRKLLDTTRLGALGWKPVTPLRDGLGKTYEAFSAAAANSPDPDLAATTY